MNHRTLVVLISASVLFGAAGGYWFSRTSHGQAVQSSGSRDAGRTVLYWYDPMVPNQHFDKPGKSPFMDMALKPRYAGESDEATVRINPTTVQNLGVRLATVKREAFSQSIDAVGSIAADARNIAIVQARTAGFVQKVYGRAPGDVIPKGGALVDLLVPEWASAQAEFLVLVGSGDASLIEAARERLRLLGMPEDLITRLERERKPQTAVTVRAPIAGMIESLDVREGMTVSAGMTLAKITGLDPVWLEAAIPEAQASWATPGKSAAVRLTAYPNQVFTGRVIGLLPETNAETRTLRVRIELPNPNRALKPGMFGQAHLESGASEEALVVPSEAVIRTGARIIVLTARKGGLFKPADVRIGRETGGNTEIVSGLSEGQEVVASGQFLIDSEANLKGVLDRFESAAPSPTAASAASLHEATGTVESVSPEKLIVFHGPVASMNWPAMTMGFKPAHPALVAPLKVGDTVRFHFRQSGADFIVEDVTKLKDSP